MSAHCSYCGTDLVYTDEYPAMECPCCTKNAIIAEQEAELTALRAMLKLAWHRTFWLHHNEQPTFDDWLDDLRT